MRKEKKRREWMEKIWGNENKRRKTSRERVEVTRGVEKKKTEEQCQSWR